MNGGYLTSGVPAYFRGGQHRLWQLRHKQATLAGGNQACVHLWAIEEECGRGPDSLCKSDELSSNPSSSIVVSREPCFTNWAALCFCFLFITAIQILDPPYVSGNL